MNDHKPKVIDLFAGAGGLSLGAARAGFQLSLAVELDKDALATHKVNFPKSKHLEMDVSSLSGSDLLSAAKLGVGELDGLIGGPPCQGFSAIGRRSAVDPRNNLFIRFFELVEQCRPRFFLAENVLGILDARYDNIRTEAFRHVESEYMLLPPVKLKASDFGAPTSRERVFFIGYLGSRMNAMTSSELEARRCGLPVKVLDALHGLPAIDSGWITEDQSWRAVEPLPTSTYGISISGDIPEGVGNKEARDRYRHGRLVSGCFGTRHSPEVEARYDRLMPGERDEVSKSVRLRLDGFCPTLRAGTGSDRGSFQAVRPIHPTLPRVITPREAARLQGFPDWYRFAPSKWHSFRQIGNSVSPILAEKILSYIFAHL